MDRRSMLIVNPYVDGRSLGREGFEYVRHDIRGLVSRQSAYRIMENLGSLGFAGWFHISEFLNLLAYRSTFVVNVKPWVLIPIWHLRQDNINARITYTPTWTA